MSAQSEQKFPSDVQQMDSQITTQHGVHVHAGPQPTSNQAPMGPTTCQVATSNEDQTLKDKAYKLIDKSTGVFQQNFTADSQELASQDHEVRGAIQTPPKTDLDDKVRDIGWHKSPDEIPDPLLGGLPNGRLWAMIRRFNKDVFDVRAVPAEVSRGLDLNDAWSDEHGSDKLTLNLQRFYLSIVLGLASFMKQTSRLRSWKETRRTAAFCLVYIVAWTLDLLMPLLLGTLIVIVTSESARNVLFPSAPRALVEASTGGLQKPKAGQLGTTNTLTGAPEKEEGEAVEEEAANFVDNVRHLVMRAVGMHDKQQQEGDPLEGKVPKPVRNAVKAIKAEGSAPGHATENKDQTQKPMEQILWSGGKPDNLAPIISAAPHVVGEIVDNWERFANALSPTPPFSPYSFVKIDSLLLPLFLLSLFTNYYMVYKGIGFAIGFGIFGDPILSPAMRWLNRTFPKWIESLEPKNNILRGVPTNNQLTITLIRIGEVYRTPIPPVPNSDPDHSDDQKSVNVDDIPLNVPRADIIDAMQPSSKEKAHSDGKEEDKSENKPKHKHLSKIISTLKGQTKSVVEVKLAVDHVRAAAGSDTAKGHLGVLPATKDLVYAGPNEFKARLNGKKGWLYIDQSDNPHLSFTAHDPRSDEQPKDLDLDPHFTLAVKDIVRLKRATAFVNTAIEKAAQWSSDKELLASVEIDDQSGKTWRFTAMPERDELFNRLVALSSQKWEVL